MGSGDCAGLRGGRTGFGLIWFGYYIVPRYHDMTFVVITSRRGGRIGYGTGSEMI